MSESDTASAARAAEFERWANVFTAHQAFSHPSELHGLLCGRLATGARIDEAEWLAMVCEHMGLSEQAAEASSDLAPFMNQAYQKTLALLQSADLSFHPLLPDDDYALNQRLEALGRLGPGFSRRHGTVGRCLPWSGSGGDPGVDRGHGGDQPTVRG